MGKVVKYTGSKLLGEELRRLRGARSLDDIVELSKQSPLTSRIHPVSAPTLSQIENGITMPSTEVLYTLSVLYNVSPSRLLHHIVEERLAKTGELPETQAETRQRVTAELTAGNWYEALALAIHGTRQTDDAGDQVLWNVHRALAMRKLGMRSDAVGLLLECAESPDLPESKRYIAHLNAADVLAEAGLIRTAIAHADLALSCLPKPCPALLEARALTTRIHLAVVQHEFGLGREDDALRRAQKDLLTVRGLTPHLLVVDRFKLELYEALIQEHLGNVLIAGRDYKSIADRADAQGESRSAMYAWNCLGVLRRRQGRWRDAASSLGRAESRAIELRQEEELFDIYFELHRVSVELADGRAEYHLKRCLRYWPLVQARTPNVLAFERLLREGAK